MSVNFTFILGSIRGVAWSYSNLEITPGIPEEINFNGNLIHINSNITSYVNLNFDNSIRGKEIYLNISSNETTTVNIEVQRDFVEKKLQAGMDIDIGIPGAKYRYSFGAAFRVQSNNSYTHLIFGVGVNEYQSKEKLNWIGKGLNEPEDSPWDILESDLEGDYLYTTVETDGYFTIVEEYTPFNWIPVIIIGVSIVIAIISGLVISKREFFRNVAMKVKGEGVPVHRMSFERVINHKTRRRILDHILKQPGVHINELMRKLDLDSGVLDWHLDVLVDYHLIKMEKVGQYNAFFPKMPIKNDYPLYLEATSLMKNEKGLQIMKLIQENGRMFQSELADALSVDKKTIRYHGKKLVKNGLIEFVHNDGKKYHQLTEKGEEILNTLNELNDNPVE